MTIMTMAMIRRTAIMIITTLEKTIERVMMKIIMSIVATSSSVK